MTHQEFCRRIAALLYNLLTGQVRECVCIKEPTVQDVLSVRMILEGTIFQADQQNSTIDQIQQLLIQTVAVHPSLKHWFEGLYESGEIGLKTLMGFISIIHVTYHDSS